MTIASRDYVEKSFNFFEDGKFYRFTTAVPNSEQMSKDGRLKYP